MVSEYEKVAQEVAELVNEKQRAYGDSFSLSSKMLRLLYPHGIVERDYENLLTIVRMLDKITRICHGNRGDESQYLDLCGYALLALVNERERETEDYY